MCQQMARYVGSAGGSRHTGADTHMRAQDLEKKQSEADENNKRAALGLLLLSHIQSKSCVIIIIPYAREIC